MSDFSNLIVKLLGNTSDFDKNFTRSQKLLDGFASAATSAGARLSAAFTVPMVGLGVASLKAAGQMEQTNIAFKTMLGSADAAQKHLADLKAFALSTPFEFTDVVAASRKMQALGFSIKELIPTLRIVGDAAAGLGLGAEGIQRITLALGQMKAKGAVQAEEMRQLAEVGIPAWQILAKTLNTDVAGAMKLVEKRAVDSATAVPAILAGINAKFGGLMEAQSQTLLGKWSNFQDKMQFTLVEIGNTLKPEAEKAIALMTKLGDSALLAARGFEQLPDPIKNTGLAIGGLAIAAGPILFVLGQLAASIENVRKGWVMLAGLRATISSMAGGVTAAAAGATGVGAGIYYLAQQAMATKSYQETLKGLTAEQERNAKSVQMQSTYHVQASKAFMDGVFSTSKATEATRQNADATNKVAGAQIKLNAEKQKAQSIYQFLGKTEEQLTEATEAAYEAFNKTHPVLNLISIQGKLGADSLIILKMAADNAVGGFAGLIGPSRAWLDMISDMAPKIMLVDDAFKALGVNSQRTLEQTAAKAEEAYERIAEAYLLGGANAPTIQDVRRASEANQSAQDAAQGTKGKYEGVKEDQPVKKARQSILQVSTIITDLSRGLTDVIFKAKSFGEAMTAVGKSIAQSMVRSLIEGGINKTVGALGKFVGSLGGFGKTIGGLIGGIGGNVAGSAVGGAVGSGVGSAVGSGVGSAAGSAAGGAASGAIGAAASSMTSMVGAIGGVVSAVSGIIGNFQMAAIGKDTGRMEEQLRGILNVLANNGSESIHHFAKQSMFANIGTRDYVWGVGHSLLIGISSGIDALVARSSAGSGLAAAGGNITINIQGGVFSGDAMAMDSFAEDMARRIREKLGVR